MGKGRLNFKMILKNFSSWILQFNIALSVVCLTSLAATWKASSSDAY